MVLGNVASSPLLDSTRSMQLSAISSTPSRTPCGPLLRFGRRITSIERLGGSPLVPRLLSFHGSTAVRGMCRAWGERRDIGTYILRNFFFKSGTSVGKTDFGKSWAKNHRSRKPLVSSPSLNYDDSPSCPVLGGAAIPPWRLLEGRPSTRKIKD